MKVAIRANRHGEAPVRWKPASAAPGPWKGGGSALLLLSLHGAVLLQVFVGILLEGLAAVLAAHAVFPAPHCDGGGLGIHRHLADRILGVGGGLGLLGRGRGQNGEGQQGGVEHGSSGSRSSLLATSSRSSACRTSPGTCPGSSAAWCRSRRSRGGTPGPGRPRSWISRSPCRQGRGTWRWWRAWPGEWRSWPGSAGG